MYTYILNIFWKTILLNLPCVHVGGVAKMSSLTKNVTYMRKCVPF